MIENMAKHSDMEPYLRATEIIDYHDEAVAALVAELAEGCADEVAVARACFEYVRDRIHHTGDYRDEIGTCSASEVLRHQTGWCYAKSHLLAALLRANGIPAGLGYQRLSCSEYLPDTYCLHGLNWVYLEAYGWYRIDPRGNKEGVDAQFDPPHERLAFVPQEDEYDLEDNFADPLGVVVDALRKYRGYDAMVGHYPDIGTDANFAIQE